MKDLVCPGTDCCSWQAEGPDPCRGCKTRSALHWRPRFVTTFYATLLADYIEAFRPDPESLSWRDFEIYQVFIQAQKEHQGEQEKKFWKSRKILNKFNKE